MSGDLGGGALETRAAASDLDLTARDYRELALLFMNALKSVDLL